MGQSLQRQAEPADLATLLEEAEERIDLACEQIDDPIQLNKLKEAEFTLWKIRAERSR